MKTKTKILLPAMLLAICTSTAFAITMPANVTLIKDTLNKQIYAENQCGKCNPNLLPPYNVCSSIGPNCYVPPNCPCPK